MLKIIDHSLPILILLLFFPLIFINFTFRVMIPSTEKKAKIVVLREEGYTQREISRRVEVPLATVNGILQHVKKFGVPTPNKSSGRRRITSKQTDNAIKRAAVKNPFASSGQIAAELLPVG